VGLGAIVVIGAETAALGPAAPQETRVLSEPMECVEILGRSMAERVIERFITADVSPVSVFYGRRRFLLWGVLAERVRQGRG
jgi:hypothetical protein